MFKQPVWTREIIAASKTCWKIRTLFVKYSLFFVLFLHQYKRIYRWQPGRILPGWGSAALLWCWLTSYDQVDTKHNQHFKTGSITDGAFLPTPVSHITSPLKQSFLIRTRATLLTLIARPFFFSYIYWDIFWRHIQVYISVWAECRRLQ